MKRARYRVEIVGFTSRAARLRGGFPGYFEINVIHTFASRSHAERFAREISKYLPPSDPNEISNAWILVYALPDPGPAPYGTSVDPLGLCYLSHDAGGVEVKRHAIPVGYFGHAYPDATIAEHARMRGEGWRWDPKARTWRIADRYCRERDSYA